MRATLRRAAELSLGLLLAAGLAGAIVLTALRTDEARAVTVVNRGGSVFKDPFLESLGEKQARGVIGESIPISVRWNGVPMAMKTETIDLPMEAVLLERRHMAREAAAAAYRSLHRMVEAPVGKLSPQTDEEWSAAMALAGILHSEKPGVATTCYFLDDEVFPGTTIPDAVPTREQLDALITRRERALAGNGLFRPGRPVIEVLMDREPGQSCIRYTLTAQEFTTNNIPLAPDSPSVMVFAEMLPGVKVVSIVELAYPSGYMGVVALLEDIPPFGEAADRLAESNFGRAVIGPVGVENVLETSAADGTSLRVINFPEAGSTEARRAGVATLVLPPPEAPESLPLESADR